MKNRSYKRKHKAHMICYHIIDYNNLRTQNIILYIIYYILYIIIRVIIKSLSQIKDLIKIFESLNQIY